MFKRKNDSFPVSSDAAGNNHSKCSEVEVIYGIDRNASNIYSEIELVTMDADLEDVDAIVVTSVDEYDSICSMLSQKISCPIIAIEDVVNEV